jgi:hypothetical protein
MERVYSDALPSYMPLTIRKAISDELMTPFLANAKTIDPNLFTNIYLCVKKGSAAIKSVKERTARLALLNEWVEHCKANIPIAYAEIARLYTLETKPAEQAAEPEAVTPEPESAVASDTTAEPEAPVATAVIVDVAEQEVSETRADPPRRSGPSPFELMMQQYEAESAARPVARMGRRGPVPSSYVPIYVPDEEPTIPIRDEDDDDQPVAEENPALQRLMAMAAQIPGPSRSHAKRSTAVVLSDNEKSDSDSEEQQHFKRPRNASVYRDELGSMDELLAQV